MAEWGVEGRMEDGVDKGEATATLLSITLWDRDKSDVNVTRREGLVSRRPTKGSADQNGH